MKKSAFYITLVLFASLAFAQRDTVVFVFDKEEVEEHAVQHGVDRERLVHQRLGQLWSEGYIFATGQFRSDTVFFNQGSRYPLQRVTVRTYDAFQEVFFTELVSRNIRRALTSKIRKYANNGYPFVRLENDSVRILENGYELFCRLIPGPEIVYDSLVLGETSTVGRQYLRNVLDMPKGDPYSEATFQQAAQNLEQIAFVDLVSPPDVSFAAGKATIYLDLKPKRHSSFEGVVGLLPRQSMDNQLALTGYLDLHLGNLLKSGKSFDFTWNRFADQSQDLQMSYEHPFLLETPLSLAIDFSLLKQDTTFLNQQWQFDVGMKLGLHRLHFDFTNTNGSLIEPRPEAVEAGYADFNRKLYGLKLLKPQYFMPFDLYSKWGYQATFSLGNKKVLPNPALDQQLYDPIEKQTTHLQASLGIKYQVRQQRTAIFHHLNLAWVENSELLTNEFLRVGGLRSLRGFNEKFYFARGIAISQLEIRQYFETSSYFMVFYDQAYLQLQNHSILPRGLGLGLSLDTSSGLFTFAMAAGMSKNIPLDPSSVKVHIGYISKF